MNQQYLHDVLVIGSGAAGLTLALHLSDYGRIAVLCKSDPTQASTYKAQGGIAAVLDSHDSVASHISDTLTAGVGLCHEDTVRFTVEQSKESTQPFPSKSSATSW